MIKHWTWEETNTVCPERWDGFWDYHCHHDQTNGTGGK